MTLARPVAIIVAAALALISPLAGAVPALAYTPAYDSKIMGRILGPNGEPVPGLTIVVYTEADKPVGQSDQDMSASTNTDANGRFSFLADSRTVYKVRSIDYGYGSRNPYTFADTWFGGKSNYDDSEGYASAKQYILDAPGVKDIGTATAALGNLPPFTVTSKPTIIGDPAFNQELFATPGSWAPTPLYGWKYQWFSGQQALTPAQTDPTYRPGLDVVGLGSIHVVVSAAEWGVARYTEARSDDVVVPPVKLPDPGATINGLAQVGQRVSAALTTPIEWHPDYLGYIGSPQWYRNGIKINGAQAMAYDIVAADLGTVLSFKAGDRISHAPAQTVKVTPGVLGSTPVPTIAGETKVGSILTAVAGVWAPTPETFGYQWYRSGTAVPGATASTYKLTALDVGRTIKVKVTGAKPGYSSVSQSSSTPLIAKGTLTGPTPTISGTPKVGRTLTAMVGSWTYGTSFKYQWYRSGKAIEGATAKSYLLTDTDRSRSFKVLVTAFKAGYTTAKKFSGISVIG